MDEDPRYLRNQGRAVHRLRRRNRVFLRWFAAAWLALTGGWTAAAAIDVVAGLGGGFQARDVGVRLLIMLGGGAVLLFTVLVEQVVMGVVRRRYGPEPDGPMEG